MKFCAYREYDAVATGVAFGERVVGLDDLNDALGTDFGPDLDTFLRRAQHDQFAKALADSERVPKSGWRIGNLRYAPPMAHPNKIWGIGLNFREHATELGADVGVFDASAAASGSSLTSFAAEDPMAWMRPATTLAGDGATVRLPPGIGTITAEAEIGVVIGRYAHKLESRREAKEAVFGFTPVLDLTAEDLLKKNVRNLTRAKSYEGFCVVGPFVTTTDEWEPSPETRITTAVDGAQKGGVVRNMRHDPYELVRFFSHVFPWEPGDILLTGTPGALPLANGSEMRAQIDGLGELKARAA